MASTLFIAGLLLAQAGAPALAQNASTDPRGDKVEVGFSELSQGRAQAAIARIEAAPGLERNDPAVLINLAAAHASLGDLRRAKGLLEAAIASDTHYDLQLADGRWMDSRRVARLAMQRLASVQRLAIK